MGVASGGREHGDDEHRDLDRDELLAIDVPGLLAAGIADEAGRIRGEVQGTGQAAAAVQLEASGLPLDMLGRMLTMVNRHTWQAAVADVDVIVEEPDKRGFPRAGEIVRAGIAACRDGDEYVLFARWLANVYGLAAIGAQAPRGDDETG
jgi:hypothetical protein